MKNPSSIPTTDAAKRIGILFRRRPTTPWDEKEVKQFRRLAKIRCFEDLTDLALVERFYFSERKKRAKGQKGYDRRSLITFLNNFTGEVDKAKDWDESRPQKPVENKIIQMPMQQSEAFIPTQDEIEATQRFLQQRALRKHEATAN